MDFTFPDFEYRKERTLDLKTNVIVNEVHHVVSTVSLSIDHSFGDQPPLWYETMIFPGTVGDILSYGERYCARYTTEEEARAGHEELVQQCNTGTIELYSW